MALGYDPVVSRNRMSCGSSRVYLSFGLSVYLLEQHCISQEVAAALLKLDAVVLSPTHLNVIKDPCRQALKSSPKQVYSTLGV